MAVVDHHRAAMGAVFIVHIKAGSDGAVCKKFTMLTLRATVVRGQGVYLGNTRHRSNEGRTYRAAGSYAISKAFAIRNELLRNHIKHSEAVGNNGVELSLQTVFNKLGQGISVPFVCSIVAHTGQILFRTLHNGGVGAVGNGEDIFDAVGNEIRVFHNHFISRFFAKIRKFLKHFVGGAQIDANVGIGIRELHTRKQNLAVYFVFFFKEVRVAGGNNGLAKLFTELNDAAVEVSDALFTFHTMLSKQKGVIGGGLNFKIIVKRSDGFDLRFGGVV